MVLLTVTFVGIAMSAGESILCAGELPGAHGTAGTGLHDCSADPANGTASSPASHPMPSTDDHSCLDDCGCPCHALLVNVLVKISNSQLFTYLCSVDKNDYLPEVYLSLVVPPDVVPV